MTARSLAEQALEHAGKATAGPWGIDGMDRLNWGVRSVAGDQPIIGSMMQTRNPEAEHDAAFIVFARTALPALAERLLALEAACRDFGHDPLVRANADCDICRALAAPSEREGQA